MVLSEAILIWLLALPWTTDDRRTEGAVERTERLTVIAETVARETRNNSEASAFVLQLFRSETDFDRAVQMCDCRRGHCDERRNKDGTHEFRAHGLAQAHDIPSGSIAEWWQHCGITNVSVAASVRTILLRYRPQKLDCSYAALKSILTPCSAPWAVGRAARAKALAKKLRDIRRSESTILHK